MTAKLQVWQQESETGREVFRAPSTNATVTANKNTIRLRGNFQNLRSPEQDELPEVLRQALSAHDSVVKEAAKAAEKAAAAASSTPAAGRSGSGSKSDS